MLDILRCSNDLAKIRKQLLSLGLIRENTSVGIYSGYQAALIEAVIGLSQIFRQKKKAIIVGGCSILQRYLQSVLPAFAIEVKLISWLRLEEIQEEIEKFDPGIVFCAREHWLTTEPVLHVIRPLLQKKRIGFVTWSHYFGFDNNSELLPYEIQITRINFGRVVTQSGPRFELVPYITDYNSFPRCDEAISLASEETVIRPVRYQLKESVISLEKLIQMGFDVEFAPSVYSNLVAKNIVLVIEKKDMDFFSRQFPGGTGVNLCSLGVREAEMIWSQPNFFDIATSKNLFSIQIL